MLNEVVSFRLTPMPKLVLMESPGSTRPTSTGPPAPCTDESTSSATFQVNPRVLKNTAGSVGKIEVMLGCTAQKPEPVASSSARPLLSRSTSNGLSPVGDLTLRLPTKNG